MTRFDVVIVGAGIAGVSLAYRLADRFKVLILERESQPAYHSTGRSAAMFMQAYGPPGVRALTRASRPFLLNPPSGFCESPLLSPRGSLVIGTKGQEAALMTEYEGLKDACPTLEMLNPGQCVELIPVLRGDDLAGGVLDPDAMEVDVHALHQGFLRGAKAQGAQLWCNSELVQAQPQSSTPPSNSQTNWHLKLQNGDTLQCSTLVNASGAWGDVVAQRCGVQPLGLTPKRRSALTFPANGLDCKHWPLVNNLDESYYFKPDAGQLLGSPANADPCPPHDVQPEELDIATAIANIEAATHLQIRRPTRTWAGLRTFAPSGEPVIGFEPLHPGFFWLVGQGGYGIQTCAAVSQFAAWKLQTGQVSPAILSAPSGMDLPPHLAKEGISHNSFGP